jgi:NAD(P)-dependent dehydrogenase (short-subunit alcohol dehydrogenase family)
VNRGTVLITGASSGIGEATARHLASLGFDVLAGVRKDADAERLAGGSITPLKIDVADQASIDAAATSVTTPLAGLVNNAGVAITGPLEYLPIDELRRQLEINVVGQVAVTQAFLPRIREGHGRIVNISSIGGRVALPLAGPYAASKFAIEAISDSLRRELRPWGIHVAAVEPGAVATPIWDKGSAAAEGLMQDMPPEVMERYGEIITTLRGEAAKLATEGVDPIEVAKVIEHALTASKPKTRYLVGRDAKIRARAAKVTPDRVMDAAIGRALGQRKRVES